VCRGDSALRARGTVGGGRGNARRADGVAGALLAQKLESSARCSKPQPEPRPGASARASARALSPAATLASAQARRRTEQSRLESWATWTRTRAPTPLQVRHWREGAVESSRSKAHLLAAAHEVAGGTPGVDYFPAYELLMDELRDYRWYAEDMLHPSPAAVDFIFDRLLTTCFSTVDAPLRAEVGKLRRAAAHRPLHPHGDGARTFAAAQLAQAVELAQRHPHLEAPLAEMVAHFGAMADEGGNRDLKDAC
jgi:hypothetical protein